MRVQSAFAVSDDLTIHSTHCIRCNLTVSISDVRWRPTAKQLAAVDQSDERRELPLIRDEHNDRRGAELR